MKYVDAGYIICLTVLACYAGWLLRRRGRLTRAVARMEEAGPGEPAGPAPARPAADGDR